MFLRGVKFIDPCARFQPCFSTLNSKIQQMQCIVDILCVHFFNLYYYYIDFHPFFLSQLNSPIKRIERKRKTLSQQTALNFNPWKISYYNIFKTLWNLSWLSHIRIFLFLQKICQLADLFQGYSVYIATDPNRNKILKNKNCQYPVSVFNQTITNS